MAYGRPKSRAKRLPRRAKAKPKGTTRGREDRRPASLPSGYSSSGESYPRSSGHVFLHVAEKPSVARELITHLNIQNAPVTNMRTYSPYNKVVSFPVPPGFRGLTGPVVFMVTSVTGHLCAIDFEDPNLRQWTDTTTQQLFSANIKRFVPDKNQGIARTLKEASVATTDLVLWLDCDREGENIAFEVKSVCEQTNTSLRVHRATFSSLAHQDIQRAVNALTVPNPHQSAAVDARSEYDLRVGSIFTRLLSLQLKNPLRMDSVISYGPCQMPTLRLVVDRYLEMTIFNSEAFWALSPELSRCPEIPTPSAIKFLWSRRRLFDRTAVEAYRAMASPFLPTGIVHQIEEQPKSRWRPIPLTTVSMTTIAAKRLRISSSETMKIAERLYQQGFISYPRTETESYPGTLPLVELVNNLAPHGELGRYAASIIHSRANGRQPGAPTGIRAAETVRSGTRSDEAHPPIHPVKLLERQQAESPNAYKVYELVARHFLATLCDDAKAAETVVTLGIGPEIFHCRGLIIHERNFLDVYAPYETWNAKTLPTFIEGQRLHIASLNIVEGATTPPEPYEEAELIRLMDRYGIGTDATMHDHIATIQERQYVKVTTVTNQLARVITNEDEEEEQANAAEESGGRMRFIPTPLGLSLIESFRRMGDTLGGLDLSRVSLRSEMERDFTRIALGELQPGPTLRQHLLKAKAIFDHMFSQRQRLTHFVVGLFQQYNRPGGVPILQ